MSGGMPFKVRNLSPDPEPGENRISGEKLLHIPVNLGHPVNFFRRRVHFPLIFSKNPHLVHLFPPTFLLGRFRRALGYIAQNSVYEGWRGVLGVLFGQIDRLIDADADGVLPAKHNLVG